MTTKFLYYQDPYRTEFSADVIEQKPHEKAWVVLLNQSCFYPGGGGQPSDRGWLGDASVIDVTIENKKIYHYTDRKLNGLSIKGKIDFNRRYDYMQQHTGQHIVSSALLSEIDCRTLSVHMGDTYTVIEVDRQDISDGEIRKAEDRANDLINKNLPVIIHNVEKKNIDRFPLRREAPGLDNLRIVEIEGVDYAACGGTHLQTTGEAGLVKYTSQEKIRNRLRLYWKMGKRAFDDYHQKTVLLNLISRELTCRPQDFMTQIRALREQVKEGNRRFREAEEQLLDREINELRREGTTMGGMRVFVKEFENKNPDYLSRLANKILEENECLFLFFNHLPDKILWTAGTSSNRQISLSDEIRPLLPIIEGKGGGSLQLCRGIAFNKEGIEEFTEGFLSRLNIKG